MVCVENFDLCYLREEEFHFGPNISYFFFLVCMSFLVPILYVIEHKIGQVISLKNRYFFFLLSYGLEHLIKEYDQLQQVPSFFTSLTCITKLDNVIVTAFLDGLLSQLPDKLGCENANRIWNFFSIHSILAEVLTHFEYYSFITAPFFAMVFVLELGEAVSMAKSTDIFTFDIIC